MAGSTNKHGGDQQNTNLGVTNKNRHRHQEWIYNPGKPWLGVSLQVGSQQDMTPGVPTIFWSWYHMISYTALLANHLRDKQMLNETKKNITSQGPQGPRSFQDMRTSPPEVANKDIVALLWFHALRLIDHVWYCMIQTCTVYLTSRWSLVFVRSDVLMQKHVYTKPEFMSPSRFHQIRNQPVTAIQNK